MEEPYVEAAGEIYLIALAIAYDIMSQTQLPVPVYGREGKKQTRRGEASNIQMGLARPGTDNTCGRANAPQGRGLAVRSHEDRAG